MLSVKEVLFYYMKTPMRNIHFLEIALDKACFSPLFHPPIPPTPRPPTPPPKKKTKKNFFFLFLHENNVVGIDIH